MEIAILFFWYWETILSSQAVGKFYIELHWKLYLHGISSDGVDGGNQFIKGDKKRPKRVNQNKVQLKTIFFLY
ncbi:hypothetical protein AAHE18_05G170500 [Arachis hypogaea]